MRNRQENNHFVKEIADMAKALEENESILLNDGYITPAPHVDIPFPYGGGKPKPFGSDIDFNGWLPRRRWVRN